MRDRRVDQPLTLQHVLALELGRDHFDGEMPPVARDLDLGIGNGLFDRLADLVVEGGHAGGVYGFWSRSRSRGPTRVMLPAPSVSTRSPERTRRARASGSCSNSGTN